MSLIVRDRNASVLIRVEADCNSAPQQLLYEPRSLRRQANMFVNEMQNNTQPDATESVLKYLKRSIT